MTNLNPVVCGEWDGCSFWARWDSSEYNPIVQYRVRHPKGDWNEWHTVVAMRDWLVHSVFREGWYLQFRIRCNESEPWQMAKGVQFLRSTADFEFVSQNRDAFFEAGSSFHLFGPYPCAYQLIDDLHIKEGKPVVAKCIALVANGYVHLSRENLFQLEYNGVNIRNVGCSHNHVKHTGLDYTQIIPGQPGLVTVSFGPMVGMNQQ